MINGDIFADILQNWLNYTDERIRQQAVEETARIRKAFYPNVIDSTAIVIDDVKALPEPKEVDYERTTTRYRRTDGVSDATAPRSPAIDSVLLRSVLWRLCA